MLLAGIVIGIVIGQLLLVAIAIRVGRESEWEDHDDD